MADVIFGGALVLAAAIALTYFIGREVRIVIKRQLNTTFYEGFTLGRQAGLDEAGRNFNAAKVRWGR